MDDKPTLSAQDESMILEFILSLPAILEGRDPHDKIYYRNRMKGRVITWTDSAE